MNVTIQAHNGDVTSSIWTKARQVGETSSRRRQMDKEKIVGSADMLPPAEQMRLIHDAVMAYRKRDVPPESQGAPEDAAFPSGQQSQ